MKHIDRPTRVLTINEYLIKGEDINLDTLAERFNVSKRTIQRDLDELKLYYADSLAISGKYRYVYYNHTDRTYRLV